MTPPGCREDGHARRDSQYRVQRSRGNELKVQRPGCFLADSDDLDTTEGQGVHQVVQILDRAAQPNYLRGRRPLPQMITISIAAAATTTPTATEDPPWVRPMIKSATSWISTITIKVARIRLLDIPCLSPILQPRVMMDPGPSWTASKCDSS